MVGCNVSYWTLKGLNVRCGWGGGWEDNMKITFLTCHELPDKCRHIYPIQYSFTHSSRSEARSAERSEFIISSRAKRARSV